MPESAGVELTRASVDAFNRGDLEWLLERIDEDFVFDWSRSRGPLAGVYHGRAGLTEFLREQWETFETFQMEALETNRRTNIASRRWDSNPRPPLYESGALAN
jgi:ketosteroid isomerase-like protein